MADCHLQMCPASIWKLLKLLLTLTNADRVFGYIQSLDKSTGLVTRPPNGLRSSEGYCLRVMLLDFQLFVVKPQPLVV